MSLEEHVYTGRVSYTGARPSRCPHCGERPKPTWTPARRQFVVMHRMDTDCAPTWGWFVEDVDADEAFCDGPRDAVVAWNAYVQSIRRERAR